MDKILESLAGVLLLVERAVQFVKTLIPYGKIEKLAPYQAYIDQVMVAAFGALICVGWGVDFFAVAFPDLAFPVAWVGPALTGLLIVLPTNLIHELFEIVKAWRRSSAR